MAVLRYFLYAVLGIIGFLVSIVLLWALAGFLYSLTVRRKVYYRTTFMARFLSAFTLWAIYFFTRTRITVEGEEKIPQGKPFVYAANHISRFDPMVVMYKLRRYRIGFISKPSNFRIPCFGKIIRKLCFLEINRENPRKAMDTVKDAVRILAQNDASVGFYPEGTRSADGKLGPFHSFMFRIPREAKVPVVVAVTYGTQDVAKKFPFPGGAKIKIKILGVLDEDFISTHRPVEIGEKVESMMRQELGQEKR